MCERLCRVRLSVCVRLYVRDWCARVYIFMCACMYEIVHVYACMHVTYAMLYSKWFNFGYVDNISNLFWSRWHTGQQLVRFSGQFSTISLRIDVIIARKYTVVKTCPINYTSFWPMSLQFKVLTLQSNVTVAGWRISLYSLLTR